MSIVGVLMAAGMMGGLALFLADMTKRQHVTQRRSETGAEVVALQHKILSVLYDGESCTETLGTNINFSSVAGTQINQLKNREGRVVLTADPTNTGNHDINRLLRVNSMTLENPQGTGRTREVDMEVAIKKLGTANAGMETMKTFTITVELDASDKIVRCHHALDAKEQAVKERVCVAMGGLWSSNSCSLANLFRQDCERMTGTASAWNSSTKTCSIDNLLQPLRSGISTNSGNITANKNDLSSHVADTSIHGGTVAPSGNQGVSVAGKKCPGADEVLQGFDSAGDVICTKMAAGTHPAGNDCFYKKQYHYRANSGSGLFSGGVTSVLSTTLHSVIGGVCPTSYTPQYRVNHAIAARTGAYNYYGIALWCCK